uniref:MHC class II beta chain N-terminal domain-containing protein n=1 Tax=Sinocyclocheilus rhinocerous TaxID=307959 RepID=A0A673LVZ9_9TELE
MASMDIGECEYSKEDLSDMVYTVKLVFNQKLRCSYDSRLGKYVGYDELGIRNAEHYNNQKTGNESRESELIEELHHLNLLEMMVTFTTFISLSLHLSSQPCKARYGQLTALECHAYDSYPQVSTQLDNGDWIPVSCRMEHSGLEEPLVVQWGETRSCSILTID